MRLKLFLLLSILFLFIACAHKQMKVSNYELFSYASSLTEKGMYQNALDYYKNLLKEKDLNTKIKVKIYNNMAAIYEIKGKNLKARKYYREAIKLTNNENIYHNYKLFLDTL